MCRFISYLRVSTVRQGQSGLGLEAQRKAVTDHIAGRGTLVREFQEIESGKSDLNRPMLAEAMSLARLHNAVLVVAKLDRLSRDAAFLMTLQGGSVRFVCADMPEANEMTVGIMAVVAQAERKMISTRTKAALAAAKAKGTKIGGDRGNLNHEIRAQGHKGSLAVRQERAKVRIGDLAPVIAHIKAGGAVSLREIAAELNNRDIPTARGGAWSAVQVARVVGKMEA